MPQRIVPQHIIAFDFGTKRIGAAAVDLDALKIAEVFHELNPLPAKEGIPDWQQLSSMLEEWKPKTVVVGLPKKMNGEDMEITRRARKFGNRIHAKFAYPVEFIDETLTTKEAKHEAEQRGHKGNYAHSPVDSIAARLILQTWLAERTARD